jgi:hypothetical protein
MENEFTNKVCLVQRKVNNRSKTATWLKEDLVMATGI